MSEQEKTIAQICYDFEHLSNGEKAVAQAVAARVRTETAEEIASLRQQLIYLKGEYANFMLEAAEALEAERERREKAEAALAPFERWADLDDAALRGEEDDNAEQELKDSWGDDIRRARAARAAPAQSGKEAEGQ